MASTTRVFHHAPYPTISPANKINDQAGRTVLVIGASAGIGFAIARAFVQANASHVILSGRSLETLQSAAKRLAAIHTTTTISTYVCDLGDEKSIDNFWQRLHEDEIKVDVLVLNAADSASGPAVPLKAFLPKFRAAFDTNLFSNTLMAAHFLDSIPGGSESKSKAKTHLATIIIAIKANVS